MINNIPPAPKCAPQMSKEELLNELFYRHQKLQSKCKYTNGGTPLTLYVYNMMLNWSGGGSPGNIEEIKWFTENYEDILDIESWATNEYIIDDQGNIIEDDPRYYFLWSKKSSEKGPGNIVSSKNPAPIEIFHCKPDINWALIALGEQPYKYKTRDYVGETKGMLFKALQKYCMRNKLSINWHHEKCFVGDDAIIGYLEIGDKIYSSSRWNPHGLIDDCIYDSLTKQYVSEIFPDAVPQPIVRWYNPSEI